MASPPQRRRSKFTTAAQETMIDRPSRGLSFVRRRALTGDDDIYKHISLALLPALDRCLGSCAMSISHLIQGKPILEAGASHVILSIVEQGILT